MIYLYTTKQIIGLSILIILLLILVIVNANVYVKESIIKYLSFPFMISIAICTIYYYNTLKKVVKLKEESILEVDTFNIYECPDNYTKIKNTIGEGTYNTCEYNCENSEGECGEGIIQSFSLDDYKNCNPTENGCFNKFPKRSNKCSVIKDFITDNKSDNMKNILKNWTDYQKECDQNRGCLGLYPLHSDNCKEAIDNI
tara:strand:- start:156 stop:752 length:597 start_codon:yes stop_codon:yes gene_type:complete